MGWILISERELHRIEVLSKVVEGRMALTSKAHMLALSVPHVHRILDHFLGILTKNEPPHESEAGLLR